MASICDLFSSLILFDNSKFHSLVIVFLHLMFAYVDDNLGGLISVEIERGSEKGEGFLCN
jgi:hypothetical protein